MDERGKEFEETTGRMKSEWVKVIEVQDMIERVVLHLTQVTIAKVRSRHI